MTKDISKSPMMLVKGMDSGKFVDWNVELEGASELFKTPSGDYFPFTHSDINFFVSNLQNYLAEYVKPGSTVGLFLPLGNLSFLGMAVYQACARIGAAVLRFGTSNIERQAWLFEKMNTDLVISSSSVWNIIIKNINTEKKPAWIAYLELSSKQKINELKHIEGAESVLIEMYSFPGVLIKDQQGFFQLPGYDCKVALHSVASEKDAYGQLAVSSENYEGFELKNHDTQILAKACEDEGQFKGFKIIADEHIQTVLNVHDKVRKILKKYQTDEGPIDEDAQLDLQSLTMVELIVALEEEFSFRVEVEDVNPEDFTSLKKIVNFVERQVG